MCVHTHAHTHKDTNTLMTCIPVVVNFHVFIYLLHFPPNFVCYNHGSHTCDHELSLFHLLHLFFTLFVTLMADIPVIVNFVIYRLLFFFFHFVCYTHGRHTGYREFSDLSPLVLHFCFLRVRMYVSYIVCMNYLM